MPHTNLHKTKKKKNWMILGSLAVWVIILFIVTIIKVTNNG